MNFYKNTCFLSILSGILIGTSIIPFPPWAMFFCLSPLFYITLKESPKKVFLYSLISFTLASLIGFFWINHLLMKFAQMPFAASATVTFFFALFYHFHLVLGSYLFAKYLRPYIKYPILGLCAFYSILWLVFPMLFPWDFSISWLYVRLPAFHFMDLIGGKGLHSLTLFINGAVLYSLLHFQKNKKLILYPLSFLLVFNALGWLYGNLRPKPDKKAYFSIAQANYGNLQELYPKYGPQYKDVALNTYFKLSQETISEKTQFLVWPETAFPAIHSPYFAQSLYGMKLKSFIRENKVHLITGAFSQNQDGSISNSVIFLNPEGIESQNPVPKKILLAFGEYLPGEKWFPFLRTLFPMVGDFKAGTKPQSRILNGIRIGIQICYEGVFASFSRTLKQQGTQIIVNLTNDSWYGDYSEPLQHLYLTAVRAVENRTPIVRSTNTGISTVILEDGSLLQKSPRNQEWSGQFEVPYYEKPQKSFFQGFGYHLTLPLLLIVFIISLVHEKQ